MNQRAVNIADEPQYDTRGLRMAVFDIIQEKLLWAHSDDRAIRHAAGGFPRIKDISYLVENLPARARILDMLVAFQRNCDCKTLERLLPYHTLLPASFLALLHVETVKHMTASCCDTCGKGREHTKDRGHTANDRLTARQLIEYDPCHFHEHGDDSDESLFCTRAWESRLEDLQTEEEE